MKPPAANCQHRYTGVPECTHPAKALVQVGTRQSDAQRTCARHLAQTCQLMVYGDGYGRPPRPLTVTMLGTF